ncbi:MAG TPA: CPBP family intramembrane metalloprotease, partial [Flavihumibacter sp.]|nr:CPBP family intramembrane metalloprotease [Flavihumibacter sp.]
HSGRFSTDLGLTTEHFSAVTYLLLLAAMVPLVAFAASQPAFLHTYPKVKILAFLAPEGPRRWQQLLYEMAYGLDFLGIELFFRGFLVVLLCRWVGPAAILPMAVFYCSVHFGKPLLECISSYFGGIILGVIACYSQSILGGILVHLGLAWMMEAAAFISSYFYTN